MSRSDKTIPRTSWVLLSVHSSFQPLTHLLKKNAEFLWPEKEQSVFDQLKSGLCCAVVLAFPNFDKELPLCTGASGFSKGAVLMEQDGNGKHLVWHTLVDFQIKLNIIMSQIVKVWVLRYLHELNQCPYAGNNLTAKRARWQ